MTKAKTKLAYCYFEKCIFRQNTGNHFEFCPFRGCVHSEAEIKRAIKQQKAAELSGKNKKSKEKKNNVKS